MPAGPGEPFCRPSAITQRRPRLAKGVTREQVGSVLTHVERSLTGV